MLIPFIPHSSEKDAGVWLAQLQLQLPEHDVRLVSQLSEKEKHGVELAIAANPKNFDWQQLPNLKWIHSTWAGIENLLLQVDLSKVQVSRLQDPDLADTMADSVLHWVMHLHHAVPQYAQQQGRQQWIQHQRIPNRDFTVCILGCGGLGLAAANKLQLLGYKVIGWGRAPKQGLNFDYYAGNENLGKAVSGAKCIVILLPLTKQTEGLLAHTFLSSLENQPALINFARGAIVDELALSQALAKGLLSHAVLDVFSKEPLAQDAWHWQHPQVTVLPHISAPTNPVTASKVIAGNIRHYLVNGVTKDAVTAGMGY